MATALSGPSNFADDGRSVIEREITLEHPSHHHISQNSSTSSKIDACNNIYEINRTVSLIVEKGYKRIALQFPDELLTDSGLVAQLIRDRSGSAVFILADTSYGSCCVDEVAAQHIAADAIIHYGRSCQSPTSRLPVIYVFGKQPVDIQDCIRVFDETFGEKKEQGIILMYNVIYTHCVDELYNELTSTAKGYSNIVKSRVETESNLGLVLQERSEPSSANGGGSGCCGGQKQGESCCLKNEAAGSIQEVCNKDDGCASATCTSKLAKDSSLSTSNVDVQATRTRTRFGRVYDLPEGANLDDYSLFYIGDESPTLSNIMMTHSRNSVYSYNPDTRSGRLESAQVNRALMRRYFLVQKAKDADVIGIAIGTLGVASYMVMIQHLKKLIESKGKKAYTFVMGKLNVAKMANFMEIDCFVYVACAENSLIDSKEFYRPIVTPYELEMALSDSREWTGEYITDFQQLLPDEDKIGIDKVKISQHQLEAASDVESGAESEVVDSDEDEAPHFSLVTGTYKQKKKYATNKEDSKELATLMDSTKDLTVRDKNTSVATLMSSAAGEYLQSRQFRGLQQNIGETPVELAVEGRAGIARGYNSEAGYTDREKEKY